MQAARRERRRIRKSTLVPANKKRFPLNGKRFLYSEEG